MSKTPILDDEWMRQRSQMRWMQAYADNLKRIQTYGTATETPESLRDDYATGKIDYDELQRRLDAVLGL